MMRLTKKDARAISAAIQSWEQSGLLDPALANKLRSSYAVQGCDWRRLAGYSFILAVFSAIVAVAAVMADDVLLDLLMENTGAAAAVFGVLSAALFHLGHRRSCARPGRSLAREAIFLCAALCAAASFAFLDLSLEGGSSSILLAAAVFHGCAGLVLRSKAVWIFSLLSFGGWLGIETGYAGGAYYLGLDHPLRSLAFGVGLIGASFAGRRFGRAAFILRPTFIVGLLYTFISLWILSIFGDDNFRIGTRWADALFWSMVFGAADLAAIALGARLDDAALRGCGLTFFAVNLYTKYFEYFWDGMNKAAFFALLAVSFWLAGRKAEAAWNFLRKETKK